MGLCAPWLCQRQCAARICQRGAREQSNRSGGGGGVGGVFIFYSNEGGGAWAPVLLSYASGSGAAKICQLGAKARERSD